jgi:hypothetical protein
MIKFHCGTYNNKFIQSNVYLGYAVLAGVTPTAKSGWYSGLNNLEVRRFNLPRRGAS